MACENFGVDLVMSLFLLIERTEMCSRETSLGEMDLIGVLDCSSLVFIFLEETVWEACPWPLLMGFSILGLCGLDLLWGSTLSWWRAACA